MAASPQRSFSSLSGSDLDVGADDVRVVVEIVGILRHLVGLRLVLGRLGLGIGILGVGCDLLRTAIVRRQVATTAARLRLVEWLLGAAFRADGGHLGQIVEACAARDADALGAEFWAWP